ncbi:zincin-like metallopeptidase domain-containing protein [Acidithiobacillus sp. YTS05]|nr:zincin-like metallopeptidase domain-containing protein [Acidithiobacillus sp. YTS05]
MADRGTNKERRDLRLEVANRLIERMEQGTAPWQRPWVAGAVRLPINAVTGKPYSGVNRQQLLLESPDPSDPRWCTYRQAKEKGWQVRGGSRGVAVEKWLEYEHERTQQELEELRRQGVENPEPTEKRLRAKYYTVFHASQIDGIPPLEREADLPGIEGKPDQKLPKLAEALGVTLAYGGSRALYRPSEDRVQMPPVETFVSATGHDTTLLHELSHSTGHESRLNRDLANKFGSPRYAIEELRAEMSAAMTAASLGIGFDPEAQNVEEGRETENSAAYLASWLGALPEKDRKQAIMGAIRDAQRISDYLIERTPEIELVAPGQAMEPDPQVAVSRGDYVRFQKDGRELEGVVLDDAKPGEPTRLRYFYQFGNGRYSMTAEDEITPTVLPSGFDEHVPGAVQPLELVDAIDPNTKAYQLTMGNEGARNDAEIAILRAVSAVRGQVMEPAIAQTMPEKASQQEREAGIVDEPPLTRVPSEVVPFLGAKQGEVTEYLLRNSEEREFYSDKMRELRDIIRAMPETYQTDGLPDEQRPVSLRYFGPGNQQWFIIEKDSGDPENADFRQTQAYGLADLGMGFPEMGYINIEEITRTGAEIDYHFEPTTLLEVKRSLSLEREEQSLAFQDPQRPSPVSPDAVLAARLPEGYRIELNERKDGFVRGTFVSGPDGRASRLPFALDDDTAGPGTLRNYGVPMDQDQLKFAIVEINKDARGKIQASLRIRTREVSKDPLDPMSTERVLGPSPLRMTTEQKISSTIVAQVRISVGGEFALSEDVTLSARALKPAEIRNGEFLPSETMTGYLKSIERGGHVLRLTLRDGTEKAVVAESVMDTDGLIGTGYSEQKSRLEALWHREVTVGAVPNGELLADVSPDRLQENLRSLIEGKELPDLDAGLEPPAVSRLRTYARVLDSSTLDYVDYSGPDTAQLIQEWATEEPDRLARDAVELRDRSSDYAKAAGLGEYQVRNLSRGIEYALRDRGESLPPPLTEVDPKEQAIAEYGRFYQELPENVDKLIEDLEKRFSALHPTDQDGFAKAMRDTQIQADDVFGIIREGPDRGSSNPELALEKAVLELEKRSELFHQHYPVIEAQSNRYRNAVKHAQEQMKERLKEHGREVLRDTSKLIREEIVAACHWKQGNLALPDSEHVKGFVQAVEQKDLKRMLSLIGHNSQNPDSQEAFSRLTGVPLGNTHKERVSQLEEWAGPEIVATLKKKEEEKARARAEEAPRKALRVAFDGLSTLRVNMGAETVDGQKFIEAKARDGFTQVSSRKKGAVIERRLRNPESEQVTWLSDSRFQGFCKAVQELEPSGDLVKAMETAKIPLELAPKTLANEPEKSPAVMDRSAAERLGEALETLASHQFTINKADGSHKTVNARAYLDHGLQLGMTEIEEQDGKLIWTDRGALRKTITDERLASTLRAALAVDTNIVRAIQSVERQKADLEWER